MNKLIYLAGPYSYNPNEAYEKHLKYAHSLMKLDTFVFSPIIHNHVLAESYNLPTDYAYWQQYNREMVIRCDELWVIAGEELAASKGTQYEIEVAKEYNKPIKYTLLFNT